MKCRCSVKSTLQIHPTLSTHPTLPPCAPLCGARPHTPPILAQSPHKSTHACGVFPPFAFGCLPPAKLLYGLCAGAFVLKVCASVLEVCSSSFFIHRLAALLRASLPRRRCSFVAPTAATPSFCRGFLCRSVSRSCVGRWSRSVFSQT